MKSCFEDPCKKDNCCEDCLGCTHQHNDECILLGEEIVGLDLPVGTDYNTVITELISMIGSGGGTSTSVDHTTAVLVGNVTTVSIWGDLAETILLGTFTVTNGTNGTNGSNGTDGTDGINGTNGTNGQSINNVSFTSSSLGGAAGQAGALDTYTVWGDVGKTINLGTFIVYNGVNGANGSAGNSNIVVIDNTQRVAPVQNTTFQTVYTHTIPAGLITNSEEYIELEIRLAVNVFSGLSGVDNSFLLNVGGVDMLRKNNPAFTPDYLVSVPVLENGGNSFDETYFFKAIIKLVNVQLPSPTIKPLVSLDCDVNNSFYKDTGYIPTAKIPVDLQAGTVLQFNLRNKMILDTIIIKKIK